ncbi:MAG TPA: hypothetical protein PKM25_18920, partial [Candidatus Ozemobacteraceae bacterium]|nr:hypothetical protein [Candidatus Ozemobacteraceae bacterium]
MRYRSACFPGISPSWVVFAGLLLFASSALAQQGPSSMESVEQPPVSSMPVRMDPSNSSFVPLSRMNLEQTNALIDTQRRLY